MGRVALPPVCGGALGSLEPGVLSFCSLAAFRGFSKEETKKMAARRPLSQKREIMVCSALNPPEHTVPVFVTAAENCSLPRAVRAHSNLLSRRPTSSTVSALCASKTASGPGSGARPTGPGSCLSTVRKPFLALPLWELPPGPRCGMLLHSSVISLSGVGLWRIRPPSAYLLISAHGFMTPPFLSWDRGCFSVCRDPDIQEKQKKKLTCGTSSR